MGEAVGAVFHDVPLIGSSQLSVCLHLCLLVLLSDSWSSSLWLSFISLPSSLSLLSLPPPIPPSSYTLFPSFPFTAESVYPELIFL